MQVLSESSKTIAVTGQTTDLHSLSGQRNRKTRSDNILPTGGRFTLADLPPQSTTRWIARHKWMVITAVQQGLITFGEACERYNLSVDEYLSWHRSLERDGLIGPLATRIGQPCAGRQQLPRRAPAS